MEELAADGAESFYRGALGRRIAAAMQACGTGPCNVEAIRVLDNGVRMAGSDPRRDGWALAY